MGFQRTETKKKILRRRLGIIGAKSDRRKGGDPVLKRNVLEKEGDHNPGRRGEDLHQGRGGAPGRDGEKSIGENAQERKGASGHLGGETTVATPARSAGRTSRPRNLNGGGLHPKVEFPFPLNIILNVLSIAVLQ